MPPVTLVALLFASATRTCTYFGIYALYLYATRDLAILGLDLDYVERHLYLFTFALHTLGYLAL